MARFPGQDKGRRDSADGFAGVSNDNGTLYVIGSESTDGSLRLVPATLDPTKMRFEARAAGVWNSTGIEVAAGSVDLGLDLRVSGGGRFIRTFDRFSGEDSMIPHHEFTAALGSSAQPHAPTVGPLLTRVIFRPDESSEQIGTVLSFAVVGTVNILSSGIYFKTGSVAATAPVTITVSRGLVDGGDIFFEKLLPTSLLGTTNTEFFIDIEGFNQTTVGSEIFTKLSSDNAFSLKAESPTGDLFVGADIRFFSNEDILTDSLVLSDDLAITFSNSGDLVRDNHTFS